MCRSLLSCSCALYPPYHCFCGRSRLRGGQDATPSPKAILIQDAQHRGTISPGEFALLLPPFFLGAEGGMGRHAWLATGVCISGEERPSNLASELGHPLGISPLVIVPGVDLSEPARKPTRTAKGRIQRERSRAEGALAEGYRCCLPSPRPRLLIEVNEKHRSQPNTQDPLQHLTPRGYTTAVHAVSFSTWSASWRRQQASI